MSNCESCSSQPLPQTIQQREFVVHGRICIAVLQQGCDKRLQMGLQRVALKALSCSQRIFLHWSPPFPGFTARSEKTAGLCRMQFVSRARNFAQNSGNGEVTCPKSA